MTEFEIYQLTQLAFINNAIFNLVVVVLSALAFYLIRRREELNLPAYSKIVMTAFCAAVVYSGFLTHGFLTSERDFFNSQSLKPMGKLFQQPPKIGLIMLVTL